MKARAPFFRAVGLCATLAAGVPVGAQTVPASDAWQFEFIPYLWAAGVRSDLKLGPLPGSTVSVSSTSVLEALDMGAMGTLEAHKGDWGGLLDMEYVKLGVDKQYAGGLLGGYSATYKQEIYTLAGLYRAMDGPVSVEVLAGARYVGAKTEFDIAPSLRGAGRDLHEKVGTWNGIVGVRAIASLTARWSLMGYLDVGEGGSSSSWQAIAGASYQYTPVTSFKFGYRVLEYRRDDALLDKMGLGGFYAGVGFKF